MEKSQHPESDGQPSAPKSAIDASGIPNLDTVLGGGLLRGALIIIVGPPGSGKTTLANQMAFAAAHAGRRATVVTAISEPTSKLIAHLRTFRFYDDDLVGSTITFMSLEQFLPAGLHATGDELIAMARQTHAEVVVLDGFRGVRGADVDLQAARQFLYDVGTTLSALGTTTIITSEADPRDPSFFPEATTADVILGLHFGVDGVLQRRGIEVIKSRGVEPMEGVHGLAIDSRGVLAYPRLEARITQADQGAAANPVEPAPSGAPDPSTQNVSTGVDGLDALLGGGVTRGSTTLVAGGPGTGKTLLALHFIAAGLRAGEPILVLGLRESQRQLLRLASAFDLGTNLAAAIRPGGLLTLQRWAPVELKPDYIADYLLNALDATGARRFVVDSLAELEHAVARSDPRRVEDYFAALIEALHLRDVTALCLKELRSSADDAPNVDVGPASALAETVVLLRQVEPRAQPRRALSVIKARLSAYDGAPHEFAITAPQGVVLRVESTDGDRHSTSE